MSIIIHVCVDDTAHTGRKCVTEFDTKVIEDACLGRPVDLKYTAVVECVDQNIDELRAWYNNPQGVLELHDYNMKLVYFGFDKVKVMEQFITDL